MSSEHLYSREAKKILELSDEILRLKAEIEKLKKELLWANQAAGQFLHAADHSNM